MASQADPGAARDPLADTLVDSRVAYRGEFLTVYKDRVRSPDGHLGVREFVRHPGAVMVIPLLDSGEVVLERQFRHPLNRTFVEFPAGKIDPGESLQACAERELLEETGYRARRWDHLGGLHNAIGYSDERIDIYLARGLAHVGTDGEAGEVIEVFTWPLTELLARVDAGEITDVKTIIGAYWLERLLAGKPIGGASR